MWSMHTVECYSALKRQEILTQATARMNLEDIMLSEISQSQKGNPVRFQLYDGPKVVNFTETEGRRVIARGWRERGEMGC